MNLYLDSYTLMFSTTKKKNIAGNGKYFEFNIERNRKQKSEMRRKTRHLENGTNRLVQGHKRKH